MSVRDRMLHSQHAPSWRATLLVTVFATSLSVRARAAEVEREELVEQAFTYAFPVFEMMRLRWLLVDEPANPARIGVNEIAHGRALSDHTRRTVTTPNDDTLYSTAILDLSASPVSIHVPDTNDRYYSMAFYDVFSNVFAYVGRRLTGTRKADFVVVGPDWRKELPANARVIRAPTNDVLVLMRTLIDGDSDLPGAHAVQDGIRLAPLRTAPSARPKAIRPVAGDPASFLSVVNQALAWNGVPSYEKPLLKRFAGVGVCGKECTWEALPEPIRARWRERFPAMLASLKQPSNRSNPVTGWRQNRPTIGNFGTDHRYRAIVALGGLLAVEPAEALYFTADSDVAGEALTGERRYRVRIPAGGIPVDAFWSLSMYEIMPDGRLFFTDNPIRRYALGDRSKGLTRNADGSIDLWIQHDAPGPAREANWLPAPAGRFKVVLRAYQPRVDLLDARLAVPAIERADRP